MVCANIKFSVSNDTNNSLMLLTNNLSLDSVFFNDDSFENSMDDLVLLNDKICGKVEVHLIIVLILLKDYIKISYNFIILIMDKFIIRKDFNGNVIVSDTLEIENNYHIDTDDDD